MTTTILIILGAVLFAALGSFTGVIIDRLPVQLDEPNEFGDLYDTRQWSEVLGGKSRCSSCLSPVKARDNIPILGWLFLRGRCRECDEPIPVYLPIVEALSAILFVVTIFVMGWSDGRVLLLLVMIPIGISVSVIDIRTFIVPTRIVWPSFIFVVLLAVAISGVNGQFLWLYSAAIGMVSLAGPLFILWFAFPKSMGFGDVRLATLLGWCIGFYAVGNPIGALILILGLFILASLLGIIIGVGVLGLRGRKARVPFGPALIISSYIVILVAELVLTAYDLYEIAVF